MNADDFRHLQIDAAPADFETLYQAYSAASELQKFSEQILDLATHMTGAENCSLMLLNGRGELYVINARGIDQNAVRSYRSKVGEGIAGQVVMEGQPLIVEDISRHEHFAINKRSKYRTGSFIACPITSREKVVGVLNINDKKSGEPFSAQDLDQVKLIALIAAIALRSFLGDSRLHLNAGEVDEIHRRLVDAERNHRELIARLSHDMRTPLNNIKGAIYYLQSPARTPAGNEQDFYEIIEREVNYLITSVDDNIRRCEQDHLRLFGNGYMPPSLDMD
jgi:GAF domain-containing protein